MRCGRFTQSFYQEGGKFFCDGGNVKINRRQAYDYQHIAYTFRNKKVEPFVVTVEPKPDEEAPVLHEHEGQELNFVIEGSMEFYLGSTTTVLSAGDSVYFNSRIPHALRALNGERVEFLAVVMGEVIKYFQNGAARFTGLRRLENSFR